MGYIRLGKQDGRMGILASECYNGLGKIILYAACLESSS